MSSEKTQISNEVLNIFYPRKTPFSSVEDCVKKMDRYFESGYTLKDFYLLSENDTFTSLIRPIFRTVKNKSQYNLLEKMNTFGSRALLNMTRARDVIGYINNGDLLNVRRWINSGFDVNGANEEGVTPLMAAAYHLPEAIPMLKDAGAKDNMYDKDGWRAITYAIERFEKGVDNSHAVKMLSEMGSDLDTDWEFGSLLRRVTGIPSMHISSRLTALRILFLCGADYEIRSCFKHKENLPDIRSIFLRKDKALVTNEEKEALVEKMAHFFNQGEFSLNPMIEPLWKEADKFVRMQGVYSRSNESYVDFCNRIVDAARTEPFPLELVNGNNEMEKYTTFLQDAKKDPETSAMLAHVENIENTYEHGNNKDVLLSVLRRMSCDLFALMCKRMSEVIFESRTPNKEERENAGYKNWNEETLIADRNAEDILNEEDIATTYFCSPDDSPFPDGGAQFDTGDSEQDRMNIMGAIAERIESVMATELEDDLDKLGGRGTSCSLARASFKKIDFSAIAEFNWGDVVTQLLNERNHPEIQR